jgi:hypothetical protein
MYGKGNFYRRDGKRQLAELTITPPDLCLIGKPTTLTILSDQAYFHYHNEAHYN